MRKLYRSKYQSKISGLCGGLAYYTSSDPTLWRILFVAGLFSPIPSLLIYLLGWIIIPKHSVL